MWIGTGGVGRRFRSRRTHARWTAKSSHEGVYRHSRPQHRCRLPAAYPGQASGKALEDAPQELQPFRADASLNAFLTCPSRHTLCAIRIQAAAGAGMAKKIKEKSG